MIAPIIARLKTALTEAKHVGGAADFMTAVENNPAATPALYVLTAEEDPAPPQTDMLIQRVAAAIRVVIVVRNLKDSSGTAAANDVEALRKKVKAALFGWVPDTGCDPLERGRGAILAFRDGHLWWQDTFNTSYLDKATQ